MSAIDWRGLCEELADSIELLLEMRPVGAKPLSITEERYARARAALAQPEPEVVGLTEDDVEAAAQRIYEAMRFERVESTPAWSERGNSFAQGAAREAARAVLARWGRPTPAAEGEVAELMEWLRIQAIKWKAIDQEARLTRSLVAEHFTRAADLLEQRQPVPVPVSERLPEPEDCDEQGRCWVHQPHEACPESPAWELMLAKYASPNYEAMCWLPAHALPLPAVEVQP